MQIALQHLHSELLIKLLKNSSLVMKSDKASEGLPTKQAQKECLRNKIRGFCSDVIASADAAMATARFN